MKFDRLANDISNLTYTTARTIVQVCAVKNPTDEEPSEVEDSQGQTQQVVVVELNDHNI